MADKQNNELLFMPLNHETQYLQVRRVEVILKALLHKSTLTQFNGDISSKSVFNLSALLCTLYTCYFNSTAYKFTLICLHSTGESTLLEMLLHGPRCNKEKGVYAAVPQCYSASVLQCFSASVLQCYSA